MAIQKKVNGTWQSINPKQLKGIPYTGTLPAVLAGTKAGYLHKYKIYGNLSQSGTPTPENPIYPSECGERTENLFDFSQAVPRKYIDGNGVEQDSAAVVDYSATSHSGYMPVSFSKNYVFDAKLSRDLSLNHYITFCWFDSNYDFISRDINSVTGVKNSYTVYGTPPSANAAYCIMNFTGYSEECRFTFMEGSTAPTSYIPYGYKLPLLSGSTPVDIYIGDDTLSAEEYVDSGTGKIYRMVSGVLTPTDPPVPFPQIPTTANSTTISWDGQGLAPSEFDSIQEWVDIPTYKRVNGEWVADNSN